MVQKSVLLDDVIATEVEPHSDKGVLEKHRASLSILIRAAVIEAVGMTPGNLADIMRLSVYQTIDIICDRALGYVENRYSRHEPLTPEISKEMRDSFDLLAREIKHKFGEEKLQIENFILAETYMIDHELFEGGYVRFAHQEGIDYTDIPSAKQLAENVAKEEEELDKQLREVSKLKAELHDIDATIPAVEQLIAWLRTALFSGVAESAPRIRELAQDIEALFRHIDL